jgi:hypothetical protein
MIGGDLTAADDWTTSLLTNPEVIAVDQHSHSNHPVIVTDKIVVWVAEADANANIYIAIFNRGADLADIHYEWKDLGLKAKQFTLRDLWERKDEGPVDALVAKLRPHACLLYRLTASN